jgi:hypothetical protein
MSELYSALVNKFAEERNDIMNAEVLLEYVMEHNPGLYRIWEYIIDNGLRPYFHDYVGEYRFLPEFVPYSPEIPAHAQLMNLGKYNGTYGEYIEKKTGFYSIWKKKQADVYHSLVEMFQNVGLPS